MALYLFGGNSYLPPTHTPCVFFFFLCICFVVAFLESY